jgi:hypothetical protein
MDPWQIASPSETVRVKLRDEVAVEHTIAGWALIPTRQETFDPAWREVRPAGAVWESQRVPVPHGNEAILSWNVPPEVQPGLAFEMSGQVRGRWSGWTRVGEWGEAPAPGVDDPLLRREVDTVVWDAHVDELRVRVRTATGEHLKLDRLVLAFPAAAPKESIALPTTFNQELPFRSQRTEDESIGDRICGATCVAMALAPRVPNVTAEAIAKAAYDPVHDIYGNWARLAAAASQHGAVAWVQRLASLDDVFARLVAGYHIICSVAFENGKLTGAPVQNTSGHLVLIRGWNKKGDVVCNDPAFTDSRGDGVVYRRSEFERLWLTHGGAAIILRWE